MDAIERQTRYYTAQLSGPSSEDAYHRILELGPDAAGPLMDCFEKEPRGKGRAMIVELIWRLRGPGAVRFLSAALSDRGDDVWKVALDGLVAIGGAEVLAILCAYKEKLRESGDTRQLGWVDEAIAQIRE